MNIKSFTLRNLEYKCRLSLERIRGLDFMTFIEPESVGLDPTIAFRSSPSGNKYLINVLNDLKITPKDSIIDIGCGKGSAICKMLKFPFSKIDGIELSEHIASIAVENFKRLHTKRVKIITCDASLFNDYDSYNMIYLYNPFPGCVMMSVIDALICSVNRLERELIIIYNNPTCHDNVVSRNVFSRVATYPDQWGNGIAVYSNRDAENSRLCKKNKHATLVKA